MQQREFLGYMNHHLAQQLDEDAVSEGAVLNALNRRIGQTTGKVLAAISKAITNPGIVFFVERDEENNEPDSINSERRRFEMTKRIIHALQLEKMTVTLGYVESAEQYVVAIKSDFAVPVHKHIVRTETLVVG